MRNIMLATVAAILVAGPMAVTVKADETITIQEQQKKKDNDKVIIQEREKTQGLGVKRDNDDVVIKERKAPPRKDDDKVIIKEK
jgi:Ni/Co efflux regulator RcnB